MLCLPIAGMSVMCEVCLFVRSGEWSLNGVAALNRGGGEGGGGGINPYAAGS